MFLHLCHSVQGWGASWLPSMRHRSHDQDGLHPGGLADPPPALWDMVNKRAVRILLEYNFVNLGSYTSTPVVNPEFPRRAPIPEYWGKTYHLTRFLSKPA